MADKLNDGLKSTEQSAKGAGRAVSEFVGVLYLLQGAVRDIQGLVVSRRLVEWQNALYDAGRAARMTGAEFTNFRRDLGELQRATKVYSQVDLAEMHRSLNRSISLIGYGSKAQREYLELLTHQFPRGAQEANSALIQLAETSPAFGMAIKKGVYDATIALRILRDHGTEAYQSYVQLTLGTDRATEAFRQYAQAVDKGIALNKEFFLHLENAPGVFRKLAEFSEGWGGAIAGTAANLGVLIYLLTRIPGVTKTFGLIGGGLRALGVGAAGATAGYIGAGLAVGGGAGYAANELLLKHLGSRSWSDAILPGTRRKIEGEGAASANFSTLRAIQGIPESVVDKQLRVWLQIKQAGDEVVTEIEKTAKYQELLSIEAAKAAQSVGKGSVYFTIWADQADKAAGQVLKMHEELLAIAAAEESFQTIQLDYLRQYSLDASQIHDIIKNQLATTQKSLDLHEGELKVIQTRASTEKELDNDRIKAVQLQTAIEQEQNKLADLSVANSRVDLEIVEKKSTLQQALIQAESRFLKATYAPVTEQVRLSMASAADIQIRMAANAMVIANLEAQKLTDSDAYRESLVKQLDLGAQYAEVLDHVRRTYAEIMSSAAINMPAGTSILPGTPGGIFGKGPAWYPFQAGAQAPIGTYENYSKRLFGMQMGFRTGLEDLLSQINNKLKNVSAIIPVMDNQINLRMGK